jgi:uncharacterized protein YaaR (DUF327 family)
MIDLLLAMKHEVEQAGGRLTEERTRQYETMYKRILRHGTAYQVFLWQNEHDLSRGCELVETASVFLVLCTPLSS